MLSAKPWQTPAVGRFLISVFLCVYAGLLVVTALHYRAHGGRALWVYALVALALVLLGATGMLLRRQWRLEDFLQRTLVLVACFYAAVLIGFWVQRTTGAPGPSVGQTVVSALSFQGAVLVLVGTFLRDQEATWTEAFGLLDNVGRALLLGWVAGCLFLPVGWGLQWLSVEALIHLPRLELQPEQQQVVRSVQMAATPLHWIALGGVTILLAPVGEEILFRGILYPWIKRAGYARLALWGTAFLFGAIHTNLATFVPLTVLALILTILYERTGNLLAPIAAHALFNAVNFFHLYLLQRA